MQKRTVESKTKTTKAKPKTTPNPVGRPRKTVVKELDLVGVQLKPSQYDYFEKIKKNEITFCSGPAGTSKTFTACYATLWMLANKEVSKVILCKPIQEAGEKLGFLPGDIADKVDPYMQSYISNFKKIVGDELTEGLIASGAIEFKPLALDRGSRGRAVHAEDGREVRQRDGVLRPCPSTPLKTAAGPSSRSLRWEPIPSFLRGSGGSVNRLHGSLPPALPRSLNSRTR